MCVLVDTEIRNLVASSNLIENFEDSSLQGASYDLRLGRQYSSRGVVKTLTDEAPTILMDPGEFDVITSHESLNLPLDLTGHFGLTSYWGMRGLVSLFGPQIDPGFKGILIVPIFNAGDSPIAIPLNEKIFTVEFLRTTAPATYGWSERNGKKDRIRPLHTPFETRPNLADISRLRSSVNTLEDLVTRVQDAMAIQRAEFERRVAETHVQLTSDQRILENRIADLLTVRNFRLSWWSLALAVVALIIGLISAPWVTAIFGP